MIKVIVFDLGNVIIPVHFSFLYRKLAQLSSYTEDEIEKIGFNSQLVRDFENGHLSTAEFHRTICQRLNIMVDYTVFVEMWNDIFTEHTKVSALIRSLKATHRLFLLSNTNELHFDYACKKFPVLAVFEEYVLSYKVGCSKPDARIFQEVIQRSGCKPEEIVYTDDIIDYVAAARKLGINAIHFQAEEQLENDLTELLASKRMK